MDQTKLYENGTGNQCTLSNININTWLTVKSCTTIRLYILYYACKLLYYACKLLYYACKLLYYACKSLYYACKLLYYACKVLYYACKFRNKILFKQK